MRLDHLVILLGFFSCLSDCSEDCHSLRLQREDGVYLSFPSHHPAAGILLQPGSAFSVSVWVRVIEGRPVGLVSPVLDLVDTPSGMRYTGLVLPFVSSDQTLGL